MRPIDHGLRIINNMLEGDRFLVDEEHADRMAAAMASHKWPIDSSGVRTGINPVHDWTSHFADAARYGVTVLVGFNARRKGAAEPMVKTENRSTWGYINKQLEAQERLEQEEWLGGPVTQRIEWTPGRLGPRS